MNDLAKFVSNGTVTTPLGFEAGATFAGMKTYGEDKLDLGIVYSAMQCTSAGVFTTNKIKSPSIALTQEHIKLGRVNAVVANSGIANTSTGIQGRKDAEEVVRLVSQELDLPGDQVAFLSTGIIGVELPMALIRAAVKNINLTRSGGNSFARAIMTTDTRSKEAAINFSYNGRTINVGGAAKGSGMIHPNMATMLSVISTDAPVEQNFLQATIKSAADMSFNMISIDGDTSTNDTLIIIANGAAGGEIIHADSEDAEIFQDAVAQLCIFLAKEVVRDGEGASKIFQVAIEGAKTLEDARIAARAVSSSSLVKTAIHGNDPNWGRIMAALGRSGAQVVEEKVSLYVNDVCIMENGIPIAFSRDSVVLLMKNPEISLRLNLHLGQESAIAWGCNLSEGYVTFNSAYTT